MCKLKKQQNLFRSNKLKQKKLFCFSELYVTLFIGYDSDSPFDIYDGQTKNGHPWGKGNMTWKNGDKYSGDFKDGKIHGQGTQIWKYGGGV